MIPQITYGDRLRRTRLAHGLNQADFAHEVRVDRALIARHELMDAPPQRLLTGTVPSQRTSDTCRYQRHLLAVAA